MRRRRAMNMVEAIVMGAAIRPRPPDVKFFHVIPGRERSERPRNLEIPGSMLRTDPE
jgi:hypothetical protein